MFRAFVLGGKRQSPDSAVFIDFGIGLCENPRQQAFSRVRRHGFLYPGAAYFLRA
jgi:hypothetical protein